MHSKLLLNDLEANYINDKIVMEISRYKNQITLESHNERH